MQCGLFLKGLWKSFRAFPVFHARAVWIQDSTRTVILGTQNDVAKVGLSVFIRQFRADALIHIFGGLWLVFRPYDEEDVGVGQTSLLKLDDPRIRNHLSQDFLFQELLQEDLEFNVKDPRREIWSISRCLRVFSQPFAGSFPRPDWQSS